MNSPGSRTWRFQDDSLFYALVSFKQGAQEPRIFYSRDWRSIYQRQRDWYLGLQRLRSMIARWDDRTELAGIFHKDSKQMIELYYEGYLIKQNYATNH